MSCVLDKQDVRHYSQSFVDLANLPAELSKEDYESLDPVIRASSESMYRVCSLIAFGIGRACYKDISGFTDVELFPADPKSNDSYHVHKARLVLPSSPKEWSNPLPEKREWRELISFSQENALYAQIDITQIDSSDGEDPCEVGCLLSHELLGESEIGQLLKDSATLKVLRSSFKALGQTIANGFARHNLIGVFDGRPLFQSSDPISYCWQDLVSLTDKQLPGLCPVCGKVIDRRTGRSGGKPKNTCCEDHSLAFQNEKKRLAKSEDPDMVFKDKVEMKAYEMRYSPDRNRRPLMFPGVEVLTPLDQFPSSTFSE